MSSLKTNNSYLKEKIILRILNLPDKNNINVLDCFHGNGEIWRNIRICCDKNINIDGIDIKEYGNEFSLVGDNIKILQNLDLQKYDIIDLDAYGVPDVQIEIIRKKIQKETIIFYTFINSIMGRLPNNLLNKIGINAKMISKAQSIFSRKQHDKFLNFLSCINIKGSVNWIQFNKKHYGVLKINPE